MSTAFQDWRKELLFVGNIVQDGDKSVPQPEVEERFNRYVQMVDSVTGNEGVEAFSALVDSLQAKDDYGAYQSTYGALRRFPVTVAAQGLVEALPRLIGRHRECAGDILAQLANGTKGAGFARLSAFRNALAESPVAVQKVIMDISNWSFNHGPILPREPGRSRFATDVAARCSQTLRRDW